MTREYSLCIGVKMAVRLFDRKESSRAFARRQCRSHQHRQHLSHAFARVYEVNSPAPLALGVEGDPMTQLQHLLDLKIASGIKSGVKAPGVLDQIRTLHEDLGCVGPVRA